MTDVYITYSTPTLRVETYFSELCLTTCANLKVWTLDFSETPLTIYVYAVYDTSTLNVEELDISETSLTT
jgi:hypothetical protein